MSTLRLAWGGARESRRKGLRDREGDPPLRRPALLVSYYYLRSFELDRNEFAFRDWTMDSGAYSAANSGKEIGLQAYIETCRRLLQTDPLLSEVFALDVIGDWKASLRNTEKMWAAGVPAIPTFHVGEPTAALLEMAKTYPKIALGGAVRWSAKKKLAWCSGCFARVWPKRIHGLGMTANALLFGLPFHSVDSSDWAVAPVAFGVWREYGRLSVRGGAQNIRAEVEHFLRLEQKMRVRFARQMAELDALPPLPRLLA